MSDSTRTRALALDLLRDHLAHDGQLRFEVVGACMAPLIEIGDEVELQAARPADLHVGDILLFDESGQFYTCLLYTSDAADERSSVDLGGRRIIKKKKRKEQIQSSTLQAKKQKKQHR